MGRRERRGEGKGRGMGMLQKSVGSGLKSISTGSCPHLSLQIQCLLVLSVLVPLANGIGASLTHLATERHCALERFQSILFDWVI